MVSGDTVDHRHSLGPWHQHVPLTSAWSPVSLQTTDINRALCCCMSHHDSVWRQHMLSTSTWSSIPAQPTEINTGSGYSTVHEYPNSLPWKHRPLMSTQVLAATESQTQTWPSVELNVTMISGAGAGFSHQYGPSVLLFFNHYLMMVGHEWENLRTT